jgi:RHS repeat-associated protein
LETRVTDYDFDGLGRLTFVDGPRSGVADTFAVQYYPNEAAQGLNRGMPERIVNGLNQTTLFRDYNAFGKPERIVDANGVETLLAYDAAGRLVGQSRAGQATAYEYDPAGRPAHVYPPPGTGATRRIDYEYFDNGLLRKVSDSPGNYILYDYDANGNRTDEDVRDASGALTRYVDFQYDDFDRLAKTIYSDGAFEEFAYNGNHDPTSFRNGNGNVTAYGPYDALNRLTAATAPGGVATEYAYDGRDNPAAATDPEDNVTAFVYNDFGELVSETSPDRGALAYAHDPAGNVISRADANGVTGTYGYDALNRLTSVSFPDSSQNLSYGYDAGAYGKGRLTSASDPAGSTGFVHDALGRVTTESRVTDGVPYQTNYAYDPATGDLSGMTYPSGLTLDFQYDANGRVSGISSGGQTLVGNVLYKPFGPVTSMDLGPLALTRTYDQRYQVTGIQAGTVLNYGYTHDGAGNVETISGLPKPDFFPRLADLTYNANRMATQNTDWIGAGVVLPSPAAVYSYDAAGNIISDGLHTDYFYNQNNRLIRVEIDGLTIAEYAYDAFERRVMKVVNGVTTHFHYDLNGLLVSETDGNGNPRKDYVYLNGEPVAMKVYGGSAGWYWFVSDHLGTPQKMVDASGSVVWAAAYAPFGEARLYKDEVVNNLRFPGQYYDVETGLHYNWHRYYDPETGRYLRPDPIGLAGGINPYVYALNSPANWIDPDGEIPVFAGVVIGKVLAVGVGYVGAKIAAAFVSEEASDGVDMAMGKVTAINATEIAGMAAGEIAGAAIGFGIRGIRTCVPKSNVTVRINRAGEKAARIEFPDGTIKDISPKRVKEFKPNTHPNAPPGTKQKVKFDNALPGTKGYKRAPTSKELKFLEKL